MRTVKPKYLVVILLLLTVFLSPVFVKAQFMVADFTFTVGANGNVNFTSTSVNTSTSTIHKWRFGDGTPFITGQTPVHTYSTNGYYAVLLILESPVGVMFDSTTKAVQINSITTGFNDLVLQSGSKVYPNPVKDFLHVNLDCTEAGSIKVFDATGREMGIEMIKYPGSTQVDMRNYNRGIYIVSVRFVNGLRSYRIIKE
jgi:hypothetical protein